MRIKLLTTVFLAFLFFGCSENEFGIFYFIENETAQLDYSLENRISVTSMSRADDDYYISAGGSIWTRNVKEVEWETVQFPDNAVGCTALTLFGSELFAGFVMNDDSFTLFRAAPERKPSWDRISDAAIENRQVLMLKVVNSCLFVSTEKNGEYDLFYTLTGEENSLENSGIPTQTMSISDVTWDGSVYLAAAVTDIFYGPLGAMEVPEEPDPPGPTVSGRLRGIYYTDSYGGDGGKYYLATDGGKVYSSDDNLESWSSTDSFSHLGNPVRFTTFSEIDGNILLGSIGFGFYEMRDGEIKDTDDSLSRLTEFTASELYNGSVVGFYVDEETDPSTLFALTIGSGLWHSTFNQSDEWNEWIHE